MQKQDEVLKKIRQFAFKQKQIDFLSSLILLLNITLIYFTICSLLDMRFHFHWDILKTMSIVFYAMLALLFIITAFILFFFPVSLSKTAKQIETFFLSQGKSLANYLVNYLDFKKRFMLTLFYRYFISEIREKLQPIRISKALKKKTLLFQCKLIAIVLIITLFFFVIPNQTFAYSFLRVLDPIHYRPAKTKTKLKIKPGNITLFKGNNLDITAFVEGTEPEKIEIYYKSGSDRGKWQKTGMQNLEKNNSYLYTFYNIQRPLFYKIQAGDFKSGTFSILLKQDIRIKEYHYTLDFPAYMQLHRQLRKQKHGHLSIPAGTIITCKIILNKPAEILALTVNRKELKINRINETTYQYRLAGFEPLHCEFGFSDKSSSKQTQKEIFTINYDPDRIPEINVRKPDKIIYAVRDELIPVDFTITDDYAVTYASLIYKIQEAGQKNISDLNKTKETKTYKYWDRINKPAISKSIKMSLQNLNVKENDEVYLRLYATDNNAFQQGFNYSKMLTIKIVSQQDKLTYELLERLYKNKNPEKILDTLTKESEKLKNALSNLIRNFRSLYDLQKEIATEAAGMKGLEEKDMIRLQDLRDKLSDKEKIVGEKLKNFNESFPDYPIQNFNTESMLTETKKIWEDVEVLAEEFQHEDVEIVVEKAHFLEQALKQQAENIDDLEKWLASEDDFRKWVMENLDMETIGEIMPEDLPAELVDMIGELLDSQENMNEMTEDLNSNWVCPAAAYGWTAADGPISSMSAAGVTGNQLPNSMEGIGRSGAGRTGKSSGELVQDSAYSYDNRIMPTRYRAEAFGKGNVKELNPQLIGGATGGGKASGIGEQGLIGKAPLQLAQNAMRLNNEQRKIREALEKLQRTKVPDNLKVSFQIPVIKMKNIEKDLLLGNIQGAVNNQGELIRDLRQIYINQNFKTQVQSEKSRIRKTIIENVRNITTDQFPEKYEKELKNYFRSIAE